MSELPEYVLALIADIAKTEGFLEYETTYAAGSNHGDNFLGVLTTATLSGPRKNAASGEVKNDTIHLLCKLAPDNPIRRREFHSYDVFRREALMYNEILPSFAKFQREKGLADGEGFVAYPNCYVAIADEENDQLVVIMDDLRPQQFAMWPKQETVPADHSYCIVEQLAKLHAISFAMKQQQPHEYEKLKKYNDIMLDFFRNTGATAAFEASFDKIISSLDDQRHIDIMNELKTNVLAIAEACTGEGVCEPFGVIGHGDCHNNNILYRHKNGVSER